MRSVIIQARYGSSRLAGKILLPIAGRIALAHLAKRALYIKEADHICFAIADDWQSDPIADYLQANYPEIKIFRGDEHDVLSRYYHAAQNLGSQIIMRVTSDCPMIDPYICSAMFQIFANGNYDYLTNNFYPSFPHGLDAEITTIQNLKNSYHHATQPKHREHVTLWIRKNPNLRKACLVNGSVDDFTISQRWTLDYMADLQLLNALMTHLDFDRVEDLHFETALEIMRANPELMKINAKEAQIHHRLQIASEYDQSNFQCNYYRWSQFEYSKIENNL